MSSSEKKHEETLIDTPMMRQQMIASRPRREKAEIKAFYSSFPKRRPAAMIAAASRNAEIKKQRDAGMRMLVRKDDVVHILYTVICWQATASKVQNESSMRPHL